MSNPVRRNKLAKEEKPPKNRRTRVGEERPDKKVKGTPFANQAPFRDKPSREDKPFSKRESSREDKPFKKKEWGDKKDSFDRAPRGDKPFSKDKPSFGDKPFKKKEWGDKSFSKDRPSREDKPYKKKEWGDRKEGFDKGEDKRSFGDKPRFGDKPFKKKEFGDKSFSKDRPSREDKPYKKKEFGDKSSSNRPFNREKREDSGSGFKKDWTEKRQFGNRDKPTEREEKPRFGDKAESGDRPFKKKPYESSRPERKPFSKDKPFKREDSRDGKKSFSRPDRDKPREERAPKPFREKKSFATPSPASTDGLIRLNKYIANSGVCSRREADKLIETGVISVNGKIVTELGFKVSPSDEINFGGQVLRKEKAVYILLNKPKDYITTVDDPEGRKTVMELIAKATKERVYPVGRLDRNTTGLLLLTNDGEMTKKLTHPRYGVKKIYQVTLDKALTKTDMQKIADGIELEDGPVKADDISYVGDAKDKTEVGIQLHSGRNRIVRRIFEHLGYDVVRLDRVYFAGLTKKDLPRGRWRMLTALEVSMLKMVPGE